MCEREIEREREREGRIKEHRMEERERRQTQKEGRGKKGTERVRTKLTYVIVIPRVFELLWGWGQVFILCACPS